jgi:hypothetical protein
MSRTSHCMNIYVCCQACTLDILRRSLTRDQLIKCCTYIINNILDRACIHINKSTQYLVLGKSLRVGDGNVNTPKLNAQSIQVLR